MVIDVITIILTCFVIHVTTGGLNGCGSSLFQYQKHVRRDYERPSTEVFVTEQGISAVIPYSNIELRNMTSANGDPCFIIQLYARATCGLKNCEVCQLVTTIHYLYSFNYIKCALQFEPFEIPTYCSCQSKK
ncbi:hypothetical protein MAR_004668 [Mya arenaria]|uniref:Uncharacterized protein n=1 Tax=Mya arenaria TaxID=6604 RepID=A0ABY7EX90_MYAAR|nr:hypothetical protein MAR_004668 [Mya arenaria]